MSDGGKGSAPRPFSVSQEEFADNFDAIFRKNIKAAEEIHSDKGYELGTKEGYEAFNKKRQDALDKLHTANEELGLYDDEYEAIHKYNEETKEVKFRQLNK
jgi:hypothetical protein